MQDLAWALNVPHDARLLSLVTEALELPPEFFKKSFEDPVLTLRPIHYTAEQSDVADGVFGAGTTHLAHDSGML